MDNLLEIDYNRYQESNAYLKNSIILIRENLCRSGEMCINFLCLILFENWSKVNPIYESNFGLRKSILGRVKSILRPWDLSLSICESIWAPRCRFRVSGNRFLAPGSRFFGL